jgi:hypothetical protein
MERVGEGCETATIPDTERDAMIWQSIVGRTLFIDSGREKFSRLVRSAKGL